jgi:ABC-type branched-subunit amino acid transport system ATPase component
LLFELISANFPNYFSILLGLIFLVIVYLLPRGVAGLLAEYWRPPAALQGRMRKRGAMRDHEALAAAGTDLGRSASAHGVQAPGFVETMTTAPAAPVLASNASPILVIDALSKSFGGLRAVDSVQFAVARGATLGLIGPNGSGKTTVLNLISGALRSDSGDIRFNGVQLAGLPPHRITRLGVARTFQLVRVLPSMTCAQNVIVGRAALAKHPLRDGCAHAAAHALLDRVGLKQAAHLPAGALTYIDQKRLELARALALEPKLLLLDEWLAGLNPSELLQGIALVRSLREDAITIIMVEHVMDAIRSLCDRCIVMNAGRKIADGSPAEVLVDREVVRAYLGDADA